MRWPGAGTGGVPLAAAAMPEGDAGVLELRFGDGDPAAVLAAIDAVFAPADMLVSRGEIAVPRLFVSDMDSTMIGQECIDELADYAGLKPQIAAITERAMQGELDFEAALRERVALLAGLEEGAIRLPRRTHHGDARRGDTGGDAGGAGHAHGAGHGRLPPLRRSGGGHARLSPGGRQPARRWKAAS
jgi:hypothetical protein